MAGGTYAIVAVTTVVRTKRCKPHSSKTATFLSLDRKEAGLGRSRIKSHNHKHAHTAASGKPLFFVCVSAGWKMIHKKITKKKMRPSWYHINCPNVVGGCLVRDSHLCVELVQTWDYPYPLSRFERVKANGAALGLHDAIRRRLPDQEQRGSVDPIAARGLRVLQLVVNVDELHKKQACMMCHTRVTTLHN